MHFLRQKRGSFKGITGEELEAQRLVKSLSAQEHDLLLGIVAGRSFREIAASLKITGFQVEALRTQILNRFGVGTTADLVRIGIYAGLQTEVETLWS